MKKERFYKIAVIVLVIVNIASLTFMWFSRPPHPPHPMEQKISERLGLKGKAVKTVNRLEVQHHREKQKLVAIDVELHEQLYKVIGSEKDSDSLLNAIHQNKAEIEQMTFDYFDQIAALCNEDQKENLRSFVHGAFQQLRPPHPPIK